MPPQAREAAQGIARLVLEGMREEEVVPGRQLQPEVGGQAPQPPPTERGASDILPCSRLRAAAL